MKTANEYISSKIDEIKKLQADILDLQEQVNTLKASVLNACIVENDSLKSISTGITAVYVRQGADSTVFDVKKWELARPREFQRITAEFTKTKKGNRAYIKV